MKKYNFLTLLYVILFCTGELYAQNNRYFRKFIPAVVVVEDVPRASKFYIGMDERTVNLPLAKYIENTKPDTIESAFSAVIKAIEKNDADAFMRSVKDIPNAKIAKEMLGGFRTVGIVEGAKITVVREIAIGDDVLIFVDVESATRPELVFFQFELHDGKYACTFSHFSDAVVQIITWTARAADAHPDLYQPVKAETLAALSVVTVDTFSSKKSANHPVEFRFKATKLDSRLGPPKRANDDLLKSNLPADQRQIVASYLAWLEAFSKKDVALLKLLVAGEVSQRQLTDLANDMPRLTKMAESLDSSRFATCVLDLGDVQVLVYQMTRGPYRVPPILHAILLRGSDGQLKVANFAQIGAFGSLMAAESFGTQFVAQYLNSK